MRFYFPDSQDQIDPNFDFDVEEHPAFHVRQRDDLYAHEALHEPASTGILVSMGFERYTIAQKHRMQRLGIREFYRLDTVPGPRIETLGDCGAFSYVSEAEPPVSTEQVIDFYESGQFDAGVSIDHVITGFQEDHDHSFPGFDGVPEEWRQRQELTLTLAAEFLARHKARACTFEPVGAAQGWSPASYADSVEQLQAMGYRRIGLGGLVALKTQDILRALKAINAVRREEVEFHLFGVTRTEQVLRFKDFGVTSIDSTSPFRQAFKDDKNNYHTLDDNFVAIRVPQVDGNASLKRLVRSGKVELGLAQRHERACLQGLRMYARGDVELDELLDELRAYGAVYGDLRDRTVPYKRTLEAKPWEACPCSICREVGVEVILFRGSERNKRRGFHNLWVFNQKLQRELAPGPESSSAPATESRA